MGTEVTLHWKRSVEGITETHDGEYTIDPLYAGCTRPQWYRLRHRNIQYGDLFATQRDAKEAANEHASRSRAKAESP